MFQLCWLYDQCIPRSLEDFSIPVFHWSSSAVSFRLLEKDLPLRWSLLPVFCQVGPVSISCCWNVFVPLAPSFRGRLFFGFLMVSKSTRHLFNCYLLPALAACPAHPHFEYFSSCSAPGSTVCSFIHCWLCYPSRLFLACSVQFF